MLGYGNPNIRNSIAQAIMAQRRLGGNPTAGMAMPPPMTPAPMQQMAGGINAQGLPGGMPAPGAMPTGLPNAMPTGLPSAMPPAFAAGAGIQPPGASPMSMIFNQGQSYGQT